MLSYINSPPERKEVTHTTTRQHTQQTSNPQTATVTQQASSSGESTVKSRIRQMEEHLELANQQKSGHSLR